MKNLGDLYIDKISIIGAGNIGGAIARSIANWSLCDEIVLLDIKENVSEQKAIDINKASTIVGNASRVTGVTKDYSITIDSDIIIICFKIQNNNLSESEFIKANKQVLESILENTSVTSPNTIYVIVTDPVDVMTQFTCEYFDHKKDNKIIGIGSEIDIATLKYNTAEVICGSVFDVSGYVLGGHTKDTMIPIIDSIKYQDKKLKKLLNKDQVDKIVNDTINFSNFDNCFETCVASVTAAIQAITDNTNEIFVCSVYRSEYNVCIGTRVTLCISGIGRIYSQDSLLKGYEEKYIESVCKLQKLNKLLYDN